MSIGVHGSSASAGGGGAVTIADGDDVVLGALADAAIVTDTTGTINGKLRGLIKWAFERMPAALGITTNAASFPVVISNEQFVAQGSTTAGQSGPLTQAAVLTSLPTWANGETRPLNMTFDGKLRAEVFSLNGINVVSKGAGAFSLGAIAGNGTLSVAIDGTSIAIGLIGVTGFTGTITVRAGDGNASNVVPFYDGALMQVSKDFTASSTDEHWNLLWPNGATQLDIVTSGFTGGSIGGVIVYSAGQQPSINTWLGSVAPTVGQKAMTSSLPVTIASDQPATALSVQLDVASATITYVGKAAPGTLTSAASWRVSRLDSTGGDLIVLYADGNGTFDNIWDNRAILAYS